MFTSAMPVYGEKKFLFLKDQVGRECTFKYYPQGPHITFRVAKENPLAGGLQPTRICHITSLPDPKAAPKSDIVTELRTMRAYEMKD